MNEVEIQKTMEQFSMLFPKGVFGYCLSVAMLEDYLETMSTITGESQDEIRKRIEAKAQVRLTELEEQIEQLKVYPCIDGIGRIG